MTNEGNPETNGTHGPAWYDVKRLWRHLEGKYGTRVVISTDCTGRDLSSSGLRVTARFQSGSEAYGCGSYGRAHGDYASKTMSAAYWVALFKLDLDAERRIAEAVALKQVPLLSEAETMV